MRAARSHGDYYYLVMFCLLVCLFLGRITQKPIGLIFLKIGGRAEDRVITFWIHTILFCHGGGLRSPRALLVLFSFLTTSTITTYIIKIDCSHFKEHNTKR